MNSTLSLLANRLLSAVTFEDAAATVLEAMLARAAAMLAASSYRASGRVARGMVHLRPGDKYRRLFVLETEPAVGREAAPYLPSATVWRKVAERRRPVAIDVIVGLIEADGEAPAPDNPGRQFDSQESLGRLMDRATTHVLALPLRAPGGAVDGMISIEVACPAAAGKPFVWDEALDHLRLLVDIAAPYLTALPARPVDDVPMDELLPVVGASMAGTVRLLRVFARQDETILLSGPTGAGKSRLACWCHEQSARKGNRFETIDLATVPEELQSAELFGWKKGAFTGAVKDTAGSVARADGGTLFLDEVDKLSLKAQARLLRVLEERRYQPLGDGAGDRAANVRFIVGTNADLHAETSAGRFREDLYYRVNVLPVRVPPLAERIDEIPRWGQYLLLRRHRSGREDGVARLTPAAERALVGYSWPGNLRQLDNIVRRAYAFVFMEHEDAPREAVVDGHHIERALAYEGGAGSRSLLDLLHLAATAFVLEAERRRAKGGVFDLDHADVLRGFVLGTAAARTGSKEEAFRLLGKEAVVQNRNHRKALRRELEKVETLCQSLGVKSAFSHVEDDTKD